MTRLLIVLIIFLIGTAAVAQTTQPSTQQALRNEIIEMSKNDHLSPLFTKIYKAISPSVVVIRTAQRVSKETLAYFNSDYIRQQFGYSIGLGSGVIVDDKNGYVVTNNHVIAGVQKVEVILSDGRVLKAEWVRSDPLSDIAVIHIPAENLTATPFADSDKLEVGSWVLAFGAPLGLPQTMTSGIVSAKGRKAAGMDYQDFIQTDAAINLGNSGGPLVNMRGEVVGINTLIVSSTGMYAGVGLAVPSNMVRNIMKHLIDKGRVMRGYLGIYIQDVDTKLALNMNLPSSHGAMVSRVLPDSPAEKADICEQDFILAVNGKTIHTANDLRNATAAIAPEKTAEMKIFRKGKIVEIKVTMGYSPNRIAPRYNMVAAPKLESYEEQVGLFTTTLTPTKAKQYGYDVKASGVIVLVVLPGSEAADANILPGMLISHINDVAVTSESELKEAIDKNRGKGLRLTVTTPMGGKWYILLPLENN